MAIGSEKSRTKAGWGDEKPGAFSQMPRGEESDALLEEARALEQQQYVLLDSSTIAQTYQSGLDEAVQQKQFQVIALEDRLEGLVEQQEARLQQLRVNTPGILSKPGVKAAWKAQEAKLSARLTSLHVRLDVVGGIKEGMGVKSPRIQELATRKFRADNGELAESWDAMQEQARIRQAEKKALDRKKKLDNRLDKTLGLGQGQSLKRALG